MRLQRRPYFININVINYKVFIMYNMFSLYPIGHIGTLKI